LNARTNQRLGLTVPVSAIVLLISRGGGPAILRIRRGRARLWTRSAARRVGGTPFRARTLFYCRRTELSRPARMCAPRPRRREAPREPPARTCRPHGAGLCHQHGATPSLYLMGCRTGGKSCRRQVTELGRVTGPLFSERAENQGGIRTNTVGKKHRCTKSNRCIQYRLVC
jgi:hypothetical protein